MTKSRSMGSHQSARMKNDEWITPRYITDALGKFDLDPCAPASPPWKIAKRTFTKVHDGLNRPWKGRVWLNPPFGREWHKWLHRLSQHVDGGIVLIPARTETQDFFNYVWKSACGICFLKGRPYFHYVDGRKGELNSGAPIVLVAYNPADTKILIQSGLGKTLSLL